MLKGFWGNVYGGKPHGFIFPAIWLHVFSSRIASSVLGLHLFKLHAWLHVPCKPYYGCPQICFNLFERLHDVSNHTAACSFKGICAISLYLSSHTAASSCPAELLHLFQATWLHVLSNATVLYLSCMLFPSELLLLVHGCVSFQGQIFHDLSSFQAVWLIAGCKIAAFVSSRMAACSFKGISARCL